MNAYRFLVPQKSHLQLGIILALTTLSTSCSHKQIDAGPTSQPTYTEGSSSTITSLRQTAREEAQLVEGKDCRRDDDYRRIEVFTREKGCVLRYKKFGQSKELASSIRSVEFCRRKLIQVRKNLENAGFLCE